MKKLTLTVTTETEVDGRHIADVVSLPGAMAYGDIREVAVARAKAIALRVVADRFEQGLDVGVDTIEFVGGGQ